MGTSQSQIYEVHEKPNTLIIKEVQFNSIMRYHFIATIMENLTRLSVDKDESTSQNSGQTVTSKNHIMKLFLQCFYKATHKYYSKMIVLGIYPRKMKTYIQK